MTRIQAGRGRGRPRSADAPDREDILRVALACFARDGYDGTGLRAIASGAGVDVALVARLYGSKLDLWKAVVDGLASRMAVAHAEITSGIASDAPLEFRFDTALRHFVRFNADIPELGKFFMDEIWRASERRDYILERLWRPHRDILLPIIREASAAGILSAAADPEMVLLMLVGAVAGPLAMEGVDPVTVTQLQHSLSALVFGGRSLS